MPCCNVGRCMVALECEFGHVSWDALNAWRDDRKLGLGKSVTSVGTDQAPSWLHSELFGRHHLDLEEVIFLVTREWNRQDPHEVIEWNRCDEEPLDSWLDCLQPWTKEFHVVTCRAIPCAVGPCAGRLGCKRAQVESCVRTHHPLPMDLQNARQNVSNLMVGEQHVGYQQQQRLQQPLRGFLVELMNDVFAVCR